MRDRWTKAVGALSAMVLLLAACGDDDAESDVSAEPTSETPEAPQDEGEGAAGDPVSIGFVNLEGGAAISLEELRIGAEAAVAYANDSLGGIGGRPIELIRCDTDGTESASISCANRMVEEDVVAVIMGQDANPAAIVETVTGAGIPYVTGAGNSTEEFTLPGSFSITAGVPAALATFAAYAAEQEVESFDLLTIDLPAALGAANTLGAGFFEASGVELNVIPVAPGTPDLTPQLTAVASGDAQAVGLLGDANLCSSFFRSTNQLQMSIPIYVYGACVSNEIFSNLAPEAVDGVLAAVSVLLGGDDDEFALYESILDDYAPGGGDPTSTLMAQGFVVAMDLVRATAELQGEPTADSIMTALQSATDVPLPLGGGNATFTCDGSAISIFPRVCTATELMVELDADGGQTVLSEIDTSPLFGE